MLIEHQKNEGEYKAFINRITFNEFNNYIKNINLSALLNWLSMQTEETQRNTLHIEPQINKIIDKYGEQAGININSDRKFLAVGLSIKIMKAIYNQKATLDINETIGYKEGLIKNNIDIIEQIIFELVSSGQKKWKWVNVFNIFFKRIDKKQLRGKDKLKKDYTKIMSKAYFRMIAQKYIYEKSLDFETRINKKDINALVDDTLNKKLEDVRRYELNNDTFHLHKD